MTIWLLPIALVCLGLGGLIAGNRAASGVAAVLLANWGACAAFSALSGDPVSWLTLAAFDYLAAIALAFTIERRWQIVVVALYALMLCAHVTFSLDLSGWVDLSARSYFLTLTALAWAQAASVGGWIVADYLAVRRAPDPAGSASSAEALSREMGVEP